MPCRSCGYATSDENARFCPGCGVPLHATTDALHIATEPPVYDVACSFERTTGAAADVVCELPPPDYTSSQAIAASYASSSRLLADEIDLESVDRDDEVYATTPMLSEFARSFLAASSCVPDQPALSDITAARARLLPRLREHVRELKYGAAFAASESIGFAFAPAALVLSILLPLTQPVTAVVVASMLSGSIQLSVLLVVLRALRRRDVALLRALVFLARITAYLVAPALLVVAAMHRSSQALPFSLAAAHVLLSVLTLTFAESKVTRVLARGPWLVYEVSPLQWVVEGVTPPRKPSTSDAAQQHHPYGFLPRVGAGTRQAIGKVEYFPITDEFKFDKDVRYLPSVRLPVLEFELA